MKTAATSSVRSPRTVVRPVRDAERTKATILAAAVREFARHGLGGTRVDRIASLAGSNKRMLYYYFSSKEKLFLAVLEKTYADIRTAEQALNLLDASPTEGVRRLIEFTRKYFIAHPEFLTLLNSENLHQARHLKRSKRVREINSPLIETLGTLLAPGTARRLVPLRRRSVAALHFDRIAQLLLPVEQAYAGPGVRAGAVLGSTARRPPRAHDCDGARLPGPAACRHGGTALTARADDLTVLTN